MVLFVWSPMLDVWRNFWVQPLKIWLRLRFGWLVPWPQGIVWYVVGLEPGFGYRREFWYFEWLHLCLESDSRGFYTQPQPNTLRYSPLRVLAWFGMDMVGTVTWTQPKWQTGYSPVLYICSFTGFLYGFWTSLAFFRTIILLMFMQFSLVWTYFWYFHWKFQDCFSLKFLPAVLLGNFPSLDFGHRGFENILLHEI